MEPVSIRGSVGMRAVSHPLAPSCYFQGIVNRDGQSMSGLNGETPKLYNTCSMLEQMSTLRMIADRL